MMRKIVVEIPDNVGCIFVNSVYLDEEGFKMRSDGYGTTDIERMTDEYVQLSKMRYTSDHASEL